MKLATATRTQLAVLGTRVRRVGEGLELTGDEIAARVVDTVFAELAGSAVLVRAYRTRRLDALRADLAARARGAAQVALSDDARCLVLVATRGYEPAWNDVERSVGHRVVPLLDAAALEARPMVAALLRALRADTAVDGRGALPDADVFHVPDALGNPLLAAQDFIARYSVRSVVGAGGLLPGGDLFALVVFASSPAPDEVAQQLGAVGYQARVAMLGAIDLDVAPTDLAVVRADALDKLLLLSEFRYQTLAREHDAAVVRAEQLRVEATTKTELVSDRVRRTQHAMLNVIEDLREARVDLENRVAARTRELEARNRELEQFAYVASHDLQEPLRTVAGYLQLIEARYGAQLDGDAHEFIRFAVDGARRMQQLIEALLQYSRVGSGEIALHAVALDDVIDDVLRALDRALTEADARVERGPLPVVRGDRTQLGQLFQNLVGNALKFRGDAPATVQIEATRDGAHEVVVVTDHGIGFDAKHGERVFAVFRRLQRKYPGTGIGLAICKKIVERHHGTIRVKSASPGHGAAFEVRLPAG